MNIFQNRYSMRLIILFSILWIGQVTAQDFPAVPKSIVTDYTKTLSSSELNALENKLLAFEDSTSTQIAIAIINTTGDYDIADYGDRLAQKWGVGSAKYNNGVLVLVALGDRAVTIRTGYGIEGSIPDAIAYRIIENEIKPAFRNGDYYGGLDKGTSAIISYSKGEYKADPSPKKGRRGGEGTVVLVIVIIIIFAIISKGGGGKGGKVVGGRGSSDLFWWMLMNSGGGRNDGGGFGGFGGGSSGGGFGGFGGGGFGGGGASGRW